MDVKTRTEKTYCIEVTEHQARDLLGMAIDAEDGIIKMYDGPRETLNELRQALLGAGLTKDPDQCKR